MKKPAAIGIIFSNNRKEVLLVKRRDVPVWVLPGGGIEENETPEETVIREVKEETGLTIKIKKKIAKYSPINRLTRITHLYECSPLDGKLEISNETKDIRFFSVDNLPKYLAPPFNFWINDAHKNLNYIITKKLSYITYRAFFKHLLFHPILIIRFVLSRFGIYINT